MTDQARRAGQALGPHTEVSTRQGDSVAIENSLSR